MLHTLLEKFGYTELQKHAFTSIIYMIHCYDHKINYKSKDKDKWVKSIKFKHITDCYDWLNNFCQAKMLRPKNTERLQYIPPGYIEKHFHTLIKYLKRLGLVDTKRPKYKQYDAILFLGAAQDSMESRTKTLVEKLHNGLQADALYILSGDRDLWPKHETLTTIMVTEQIAKKLKSTPSELRSIYRKICHKINKLLPEEKFLHNSSFEINALREEIKEHFEHKVSQQGEYPRIIWPNELDLAKLLVKNYKVPDIISTKYINAPKRQSGSRPNTLDTFVWFEKDYKDIVKESGRKHKLLLISGQPFVEYQTIIAKSILSSDDYYIEGIGRGDVTTDFQAIAICLD